MASIFELRSEKRLGEQLTLLSDASCFNFDKNSKSACFGLGALDAKLCVSKSILCKHDILDSDQ